jgi:YD repeat-containing protein
MALVSEGVHNLPYNATGPLLSRFSDISAGYINLYAADSTDPTVATSGRSDRWQAGNVPIEVTAADNGTGVESVSLQNSSGSRLVGATQTCPATGSTLCPFTMNAVLSLESLPEGRQVHRLVAADGGGRMTSLVATVSIDRQDPKVVLEGDLYTHRSSSIGGDSTRSLRVRASDSASGLRLIRVLYRGAVVAVVDRGTMPVGPAALDAGWAPPLGVIGEDGGTVRVEAEDQAGRTTVSEFQVSGGVAVPSINEAAGDLPRYEFGNHDLADGSRLSVNIGSGNVLLRAADVVFFDTDLDYQIERSFNSYNVGRTGALGRGWALNFGQDVKLDVQDSSARVVVPRHSGARMTFVRQSDGEYAAPVGVSDTLRRVGAGWIVTDASEGSETQYDSAGYETSRRLNDGEGTVLTAYDSAGRMSTVSDDLGRSIEVAYSSRHPDLVERITAPDGKQSEFSYDNAGDLVAVTHPDGTITAYGVRVGGGRDELRVTTPDGDATTAGGVSVSAGPDEPRSVAVDSAGEPIVRYVSRNGAGVATVRRGDPDDASGSMTRSEYGVDDGTYFAARSDSRTDFYSPAGTSTSYSPGAVALTGGLYELRDRSVPLGVHRLAFRVSESRTGGVNHGVSEVKIYVDSREVETFPQDCATACPEARGEWELSTSEWEPGPHAIRVVAANVKGIVATRAISVTIPSKSEIPDPDVDGPEADFGDLDPLDGAACEAHYGVGSPSCFEEPDFAAPNAAAAARRSEDAGVALTGTRAAALARTMEDSADPEAAPISTEALPVATRAIDTKALVYGISQGELAGKPKKSEDELTESVDVSYFGAPVFTEMKVKHLRVVVPYNIANSPARVSNFRRVYDAANASGTRLLVSVNFRCRPKEDEAVSCYAAANYSHRPGQKEYVEDIRRFRNLFPRVRFISAFNEPNHPKYSPVAENARAAAMYTYLLQKQVCSKAPKRAPCSVVAGDFAGDTGGWRTYMKQYKASLAHRFERDSRSGDMPTIWGFHPYSDVQSRKAPSRSDLNMFAQRVPRGSRIWLTEVGGKNHGRSASKLSDSALEDRQADQVRYLIDVLAVARKSYAHVYYYTLCFGGQRNAVEDDGTVAYKRGDFDTALLGTFDVPAPRSTCADQPARSAYRVFRNRSAAAG